MSNALGREVGWYLKTLGLGLPAGSPFPPSSPVPSPRFLRAKRISKTNLFDFNPTGEPARRLQFASMKGTSGYNHIIKLEELLLKNRKWIWNQMMVLFTVNRSVIFLYSIVIVLALYMFINLKLLLLWWNTYRPNFNPPLPFRKKITIKKLYGTCPEKFFLQIYLNSKKKKKLLRSHSSTPPPPLPPPHEINWSVP